jgi:glycosyltransferase involved in cell wall biosynthesis
MKMSLQTDTLTIVIPALNEEEAIGGTITRCLEAREIIKRTASLDDVEIIVVSDGSTDRTAEIARTFPDIGLIEFDTNRGYGAAIKEGFRQGKGSLVGFIDADGTCNPDYFAEMCRVIVEDGADLALGSRLGPTSMMPRIRKLGNRIYALILGVLCGRRVTDTASGMRVIRRAAINELYPLPDRMHFTPSMSARALLSDMRVVEVPMHYQERIGTSKLSVLGDGVRFLKTILDGVLCYRPERLFLMGFITFFVIATLLGLMPVEHYLRNRSLEEWMVYRLMTCAFFGLIGFMLLSSAALAQHMTELGPRRREGADFWPSLAARFFEGKALATMVITVTVVSIALLWPGLFEFATTGHVSLHWSRLLFGTFGLLLVSNALITNVLIRVLSLWRYQRVDADLRRRGQNLIDHGPPVASTSGPIQATSNSRSPVESAS